MKRLAATLEVVAQMPQTNAVNAAKGWRPAMDHVGIDVHKKESQVCILTEEGEVVEARIATTRERFLEVLGGRPRCRILLESATESEWVARVLEGRGHEVIVADPNYAPMYGTRTRRVKTDQRDARALAEACRLGIYRPAHRRSEEQRHVTARLAVRDALVQSRTKFICLVRALLRREGFRVPSGQAGTFAARVAGLKLPGRLRSEVGPLLVAMVHLNKQIAYSDAVIERVAARDDVVQRLSTAPRIGPITAAALRATVDDEQRFRDAHQFEAYIGLVPSEMSSGEKQRRGRITRTGDSRLRWLLVQAAHRIRYDKGADSVGLRQWAKRIESRRGRGVATVALARKLAGILFAMMRDGTKFEPGWTSRQPTSQVAA